MWFPTVLQALAVSERYQPIIHSNDLTGGDKLSQLKQIVADVWR